jgi:hypothetical protein
MSRLARLCLFFWSCLLLSCCFLSSLFGGGKGGKRGKGKQKGNQKKQDNDDVEAMDVEAQQSSGVFYCDCLVLSCLAAVL